MVSSQDDDWYLQEWLAYFKKKQAALMNELGWSKAKGNDTWHGRQRYNRDMVNEVAAWLNIAPYELLLPPKEAIALRDLRQNAMTIAAAQHADRFLPAEPIPNPRRKTGTAS